MTEQGARDGFLRGAGASAPVEGRPEVASPAGPPIAPRRILADASWDELVAMVSRALPADVADSIIRQALATMNHREDEIRRACRSALDAERNYQAAVNDRATSRYGAERRQRAIDVARRRRDQTAKELGL